MVPTWSAFGFKLAFPKGQLGTSVTWIGGTLTAEKSGVKAVVKASIIEDILDDLSKFSRLNVISVKELQSLLGKINHAAGLLIVLRPFMEPMWAAIKEHDSGNRSGAPPGTIWTKQIAQSLQWYSAFFAKKGTHVERFFSVSAYLRQGTVVEIGTDASPWGLGGWLSINGAITHYFGCPVTPSDAEKYGFAIGDSDGQQIWERLAILVAESAAYSKSEVTTWVLSLW